MGNWFGKSRSRVTDHDQVVLQLKCQRDRMKQMEKQLHVNMERERNVARTLLSLGKRDGALLILKKKRFLEKELLKLAEQLDKVEQLIHGVQSAQVRASVLSALKDGNACLANLNRVFNLNEVENILQETQISAEYQQQISDLISNALSGVDDEAVDQDFQQLLNETDEIILPDVPKDTPVIEKQSTEKEKPMTLTTDN
ncbi:Charged multivesicular body protein 6 [Trichinella zimbabwensis]|uniref:Charged multivesicular body protein 6 n=1 Tax=Trichinella zimbabwensis TaxID=268475 RepID=A0A0V1HBF4_9BILA|nr:Charged multivesicular body protein 6 [Trichinella zimbabwensis]